MSGNSRTIRAVQPIRHHRLKQLATRLAFLPGLWFCRALVFSRIWRTWHRVDEHLIIGAFPTVRELHQLQVLGVRMIINLCEEHPGSVAAIERLGLRQTRIPCLDFHVPPHSQIEQALGVIRVEGRAGRITYLHCKAGRLRSAIVAMAWLIRERGMSPADAAQHLRAMRSQVDGRLVQRVDWARFMESTRIFEPDNSAATSGLQSGSAGPPA